MTTGQENRGAARASWKAAWRSFLRTWTRWLPWLAGPKPGMPRAEEACAATVQQPPPQPAQPASLDSKPSDAGDGDLNQIPAASLELTATSAEIASEAVLAITIRCEPERPPVSEPKEAAPPASPASNSPPGREAAPSLLQAGFSSQLLHPGAGDEQASRLIASSQEVRLLQASSPSLPPDATPTDGEPLSAAVLQRLLSDPSTEAVPEPLSDPPVAVSAVSTGADADGLSSQSAPLNDGAPLTAPGTGDQPHLDEGGLCAASPAEAKFATPPDQSEADTLPTDNAPEAVTDELTNAHETESRKLHTDAGADSELMPVAPAMPRPSRYQPRLGRRTEPAPEPKRNGPVSQARPPTHGAELLLLFANGGWTVTFSALLHRTAEMEEAVQIRSEQGSAELWSADERLFGALNLESPARVLKEGFYAEAENGSARWLRSARELHVFSPREGITGFCTAPRLRCGVENVVVCSSSLEAEVLAAFAKIGVESPVAIEAPLPDGWRGYRRIFPSRTDAGLHGLLEALNPVADVSIQLSGGVRTGPFSWLTSSPPAIMVTGGFSGPVLIDGGEAEPAEQGWRRDGWDTPGQHRVEHGGVSRSYRLEAAPTAWLPWSAHAGSGATICGALVSCGGAAASPAPLDTPCWLIGAHPGEATYSTPDDGALSAPPFDVIWAIPASGRRRRPPILLGAMTPPQQTGKLPTPADLRWCSVIREASLRHPRLDDPAAASLWRAYSRAARSGWKRR
jgi:hypothetical protein